jgi:hypothetical protein
MPKTADEWLEEGNCKAGDYYDGAAGYLCCKCVELENTIAELIESGEALHKFKEGSKPYDNAVKTLWRIKNVDCEDDKASL